MPLAKKVTWKAAMGKCPSQLEMVTYVTAQGKFKQDSGLHQLRQQDEMKSWSGTSVML